MGTTISSIMQKSKPFKLFWSSTSSKSNETTNTSTGNLSLQDGLTPGNSLPTCSYHNILKMPSPVFSHQMEPSPTPRSQQQQQGESSMSTSSYLSPMECKSTKPPALTPKHLKIATPNTPLSSRERGGASDGRRKPQRSSEHKSRGVVVGDSKTLHRCASEPVGHATRVHRTHSDMPMTTSGEAHSVPQGLSIVATSSSNKHMEGWSLTRPAGASKPTDHCPSTNSVTHVASASHSSSASGSMKTTDGSWVSTNSSEDEAAVPIDKKAVIPKHALSSNQEKCIKIGSGEFGEVLFGRMKSTGQLVAVKALKREKSDLFALLQEAFVLQIASDTDYAPKYLGLTPFTVLGDKFLEWAIVLEFVGNSDGATPYDFRKTLRYVKSVPHTLQLFLEWIYTSAKIVHAVNQFHSMGILINDIKADNILLKPVGNGYHPVFVDFGLASISEGITLALEVNDSNRSKILKEYSHIAPEVLFGGETNSASDIFSLGKALGLIADIFHVEPFTQVISRCTLWNVTERPSASDLIENLQWISNSAFKHL